MIFKVTNIEVLRFPSENIETVEKTYGFLRKSNEVNRYLEKQFPIVFSLRAIFFLVRYFLLFFKSNKRRELKFLSNHFLYIAALLKVKKHINYIVWTFPAKNDPPLFYFHINVPFLQNQTDGGKPHVSSIARGFSLNKCTALSKALGECLERFPFLYYRNTELKVATSNDLKNQSLNHLAIEHLSPFSNAQKTLIPSYEFSGNQEFRWVGCFEIGKNNDYKSQECLVPAQAVFWKYAFLPQEPRLVSRGTYGMAGWFSEAGALNRAISENIERDGFFLYWLLRASPRRVALGTIDSLRCQQLIRIFKNLDIKVYILDVTSPDITVPNFFCILEGNDNNFGIVGGAGCAEDVESAIYKSLEEAASMVHWIRLNKRHYKEKSILPYTVSYDDWDRLNFWADVKNRAHIQFFISGHEFPFAYFVEKYEPFSRKDFSMIINHLIVNDHKIFWKSRQTNLMKRLGYFSVKCVIPTLVPTFHDMREAPLGHPRLTKGKELFAMEGIPVQMSNGLNDCPHPFP